MLHRLREAMKRDDSSPLMAGVLVADETWIGGDPGNRHARKRIAEGPARWATQKTTVLSVIDKATGEARSAIIPNVKGSTLRKAMEEELAINLGASTLHTYSWKGYVQMAGTLKGHESVNHNRASTCAATSPATWPKGSSPSSNAPSTALTTTSAPNTYRAT
jgi:ISXO2-like transposase domain